MDRSVPILPVAEGKSPSTAVRNNDAHHLIIARKGRAIVVGHARVSRYGPGCDQIEIGRARRGTGEQEHVTAAAGCGIVTVDDEIVVRARLQTKHVDGVPAADNLTVTRALPA